MTLRWSSLCHINWMRDSTKNIKLWYFVLSVVLICIEYETRECWDGRKEQHTEPLTLHLCVNREWIFRLWNITFWLRKTKNGKTRISAQPNTIRKNHFESILARQHNEIHPGVRSCCPRCSSAIYFDSANFRWVVFRDVIIVVTVTMLIGIPTHEWAQSHAYADNCVSNTHFYRFLCAFTRSERKKERKEEPTGNRETLCPNIYKSHTAA